MKKHPLRFVSAIFLLALYFFTGCTKQDNPWCPQATCVITGITSKEGKLPVTAAFEYNTEGNPLRRTRSDASTGSANFSFRYNSRHKLSALIEYYDSDSLGSYFYQWHSFVYNGVGQIVFDTIRINGTIGEGPLPMPIPVNTILAFRSFVYDAQGRITEEKYGTLGADLLATTHYYYDTRQNLEKIVETGAGGYEQTTTYSDYDNKINLSRTNPIWQFLNRDYSVNNANAVSWNSKGLPLHFSGDTRFTGIGFTNATVTYQCK